MKGSYSTEWCCRSSRSGSNRIQFRVGIRFGSRDLRRFHETLKKTGSNKNKISYPLQLSSGSQGVCHSPFCAATQLLPHPVRREAWPGPDRGVPVSRPWLLLRSHHVMSNRRQWRQRHFGRRGAHLRGYALMRCVTRTSAKTSLRLAILSPALTRLLRPSTARIRSGI